MKLMFLISSINVIWSSSLDNDQGVDRKSKYFPNKNRPRRVSEARRYHVSAVEIGTINQSISDRTSSSAQKTLYNRKRTV